MRITLRRKLTAIAVFVMLLSPLPVGINLVDHAVLERATVDHLQLQLEAGKVIAMGPSAHGTPTACAELLWFEAHDVNFALGGVLLLAVLATISIFMASLMLFIIARKVAS